MSTPLTPEERERLRAPTLTRATRVWRRCTTRLITRSIKDREATERKPNG